MKDFYYILGVSSNSPAPEIREAYRKLSKKFHPDVNQNDSYFESRFKEIQEAYETLSDPLKRKRYNAAFNNNSAPPRTDRDPPPKQKYYPRTTAVDVVFTVVLISITVLFGNYVWNAINGSKIVNPIKPAAVTNAPPNVNAPAHHKRKKHLIDPAGAIDIPKKAPQNKPVPVNISPTAAIGSYSGSQKPVVKNNTENKNNDTFQSRSVPIKQSFKPAQANNINESNNLPYSSYLRSNITGVINMHKADNLNSGVVAVIPANSKVMVLAKGVNYYKVRFTDDTGYVPAWTVKSR